MTHKQTLPYRPCAGIMLFNKQGRVLVGQRLDTYLNAWQLPQGGINEGEEPKTAVFGSSPSLIPPWGSCQAFKYVSSR